MSFFDFANEHWFVTLLLAWSAAGVIRTPFYYAFKAYNRHLRHKNIALHGWPTPPIDADGDIIYPDEDEES